MVTRIWEFRENVELREKLRRMHAVTPDTEYYLNHYSHMCGMIPQEYEKTGRSGGVPVDLRRTFRYCLMQKSKIRGREYANNQRCSCRSRSDFHNSIQSIE